MTELSEDGTDIRFSDDGRYAIWQREGEGGMRTWVHDLSGSSESFAVEGEDVQLLAGGAVIYRRVADNQAVRSAGEVRDEAIEQARAESNWDLWRSAQADYDAVVRSNTLLLYREGPGAPERVLTPQGYAIGEVISSPDGQTLYFTGQQEGKPTLWSTPWRRVTGRCARSPGRTATKAK